MKSTGPIPSVAGDLVMKNSRASIDVTGSDDVQVLLDGKCKTSSRCPPYAYFGRVITDPLSFQTVEAFCPTTLRLRSSPI